MITDECTSEPLSMGRAETAFSAAGSLLAAMDSATSISSTWSLGFLFPR